MTTAEAIKLIAENKNNTSWYGKNSVDMFGDYIATYDKLYETLRHHARLGEAETKCIIGALKLSGAKIK